MMNKIYLDNAATSFPKAPGVADAIYNYIENIGGNVGRGTYSTAFTAGQTVYETRELLAELFNFNNPLNCVLTSNITQSVNILLKGFLKPGDHVIVSSMEHNAIMRPLSSLSLSGIEFSRVPCNNDGTMNPAELIDYIKPNTKLVIMTHASNVCGTILPIEDIGKICREHGIEFIIDSAQSAGVLDIDFERLNLSALAFTGHKGLLGPQGTGGFVISDSFSHKVSSFHEGGTGSLSESEIQPDYLPDKFESGTLNIPGIYGLNASLKYLKKVGIEEIRRKEDELTGEFIKDIVNIEGLKLAGLKSNFGRTSVVSIDFTDYDNSEVAFHLEREFGIMTRVGLHCAPNAHKTLNTFPTGTVRFSFGHMNTLQEIKYAVESIHKTLKMI
jgi:cysteine desulfurase family protein